jgi:hypothetical protein
MLNAYQQEQMPSSLLLQSEAVLVLRELAVWALDLARVCLPVMTSLKWLHLRRRSRQARI